MSFTAQKSFSFAKDLEFAADFGVFHRARDFPKFPIYAASCTIYLFYFYSDLKPEEFRSVHFDSI